MFLNGTLAFQSSMDALLSATENGLTPGGMLLAEWLVCQGDALTYSCAKQRIFITSQ
jgi:hypothetical protein